MKISVENFKSISSLQNFEIKPFTILSGVNSSGKSSFIQLLLLLKQTAEKSSTNDIFTINGKYYKVSDYKNLVYQKDLSNSISISFVFDKSEFGKLQDTIFLKRSDNAEILVSFGIEDNNPYIDTFKITLKLQEGKNPYLVLNHNKETNTYKIDANDQLFGEGIWNENVNQAMVDFVAFYPNAFEKDGEKKIIRIDWAKKMLDTFLINISYLGPDRETPKNEYTSSTKSKESVGIKGEKVAQILQEKANEKIEYYILNTEEDSINFVKKESTLSQAVKYWMCDVFDVANDIYSEKTEDIYKIILKTKSGLEINIKHVGFGISQLLPIVVEGLLMKENRTLIVEQPEIHLHPKIQSQLFDFLYSLTLQGKKVIVETHSSHFITRMRRRIAEDESNKMADNINLTFIEDNVFRTIKLDDYGTLDYFPKDFIEQDTMELKAIIKAQMKKRSKK